MEEIAGARQLAGLAAASEIELKNLPVSTSARTVRVIADSIGVMIAGGRDEPIVKFVTAAPVEFGNSQLFVGGGNTCSAESAAFANGTAGGTLEMDEGNRPYGHPGMHVLPAVLAVAQSIHASGSELMEAFLTGYEATTRLFRSYRLSHPMHAHGHLGGIGAAVGVARLLGTDPGAAAAVAATSPLLTVWSGCYEGATARNTFMGAAASNAIRSCRLSAAGMRGSVTALDDTFDGLVGRLVDPDALSEPVDPLSLSITKNYFKPYGACALVLTAIEAALALRPEWIAGGRPSGAGDIQLETSAGAMHLSRQPYENDLSSRFSLQYAVAAALLLGHAGLRPLYYHPAVAELAHSVTVTPLPEYDKYAGETTPARVSLREAKSSECIYAPGDYRNPLSDEQLREKFTHLVAHPAAEDLYERILHLRDFSDSNDIAPSRYWARRDPTHARERHEGTVDQGTLHQHKERQL